MALSICVKNCEPPSDMMIRTFSSNLLLIKDGITTLKIQRSIQLCWFSMNHCKNMNIFPFESFPPTVRIGLFSLFVFSTVSTIMTFGKESNNLNSFVITHANHIMYFWLSSRFFADLPILTFVFKDSISSMLKSFIG